MSQPDEHAKLAHDLVVRKRMAERKLRTMRIRRPSFLGLTINQKPDGVTFADVDLLR